MSIEDLASKTKLPLEEVKMWESGEKAPSYRRLEDMAYKYYQVPVAVFFFPHPPKIEDPVSKFRRLPDYEIEKFSDDTFKKIMLSQAYQDSLFDVLKGNEPKKSIIGKFANTLGSPENLAKIVREYIGVSFEDQFNFHSNDSAFKQWRYAIEQVGVFTFKDTFKDKFISGFCLYDATYPIIMLNNSNSFARQTFSLIHELGHIILGVSGVTDLDESYFNYLEDKELKTEIFCNQFASEFLVPSDEFKHDIKIFLKEGMDAVSEIAKQYSVSREVILRKLLDNDIITQRTYNEKSKLWNEDYLRNAKEKKGGNYYLTKVSYLGESFTKYAFTRHRSGLLSEVQLANHLNVKARNLSKLEATVRW